ncbi:MAG: tRNA threonylcarbamoyladenosine dehydratase [Opitutales bacterium]|nr:tRNA threonylcarbamoyladenosine dehydratase [Opitutales bacterium]
MDRFSRTEVLYGAEFLKRLRGAKFLVCGAGAVGGFAIEALARTGAQNFVVADCDSFDITNINRQLGALSSTVGKKKAEVWKSRILEINPLAKVETADFFIDESTAPQLLDCGCDVVVDAIDTLKPKFELLKQACLREMKVVSSMGAARRKNPEMVKCAKLMKTSVCPLASSIRKSFRKMNLKPSFMCVYSDEAVGAPTHVSSGGADSRKVIGSGAVVTGVFGLMLANLALKEVL